VPCVLTEASKITCPHGGSVQFAAKPAIKLKVSGKRVIVGQDLNGAARISACQTKLNSNPPTKPCENVTIGSGFSSRLKVNGDPVLTTNLVATTDGVLPPSPPPPFLLANTAEQDKLTTN
jgi:hypothetical protein